MELFDVYPRYNITVTEAKGSVVFDDQGKGYLDLYGGHGVISIGHQHPAFVSALQQQLQKLSFYSNVVNMPIQQALANKLGALAGLTDYQWFMCNSGAEATENALKLASFHNHKKKIIAFRGSFHGRSTAAAMASDSLKQQPELGKGGIDVQFLPLNDIEAFDTAFDESVSAVIVEGIQGVGGLDMPSADFLQHISTRCQQSMALLICDEVQSGLGRSGRFFAYQRADIKPDIVCVAKGLGNGFPVGGLLISPKIKASAGLLGSTFGANPLACAAALSVLETIEKEQLTEAAAKVGKALKEQFASLPGVQQVKGEGLMLGVEFKEPVSELRRQLLMDYQIFTGGSANPNLLRILPPLNITVEQVQPLIQAIQKISNEKVPIG